MSAVSPGVATLTEQIVPLLMDGLDEWLHRMHGIVSSCDHRTEAEALAAALAPVIATAQATAVDAALRDAAHDWEYPPGGRAKTPRTGSSVGHWLRARAARPAVADDTDEGAGA